MRRKRKIQYTVEAWDVPGSSRSPRTRRRAFAYFNSLPSPATIFRFMRYRPPGAHTNKRGKCEMFISEDK